MNISNLKSTEIDPYRYSCLIFDNVVKTSQWRKDSLFNNRCWKIECPHAKTKIILDKNHSIDTHKSEKTIKEILDPTSKTCYFFYILHCCCLLIMRFWDTGRLLFVYSLVFLWRKIGA